MNISLSREAKGFNVLVYKGSVAGQLVGAYVTKEDALKFLNSEAILNHYGVYSLVCMDTNELLKTAIAEPAVAYEPTSNEPSEEVDDSDEEIILDDDEDEALF